MPDPRRLYRRIAQSALPARLIAHLSVVVLVAAASFAGASAAGAAPDAEAGFLNLVSSVRGAGDQPQPAPASSFETLPPERVMFLNRGAAPVIDPTSVPMPSPVPLDPEATPLAAPGSGSAGVPLIQPTSSGTVAAVPRAGGFVWPLPGGVITQGFHGGHLAYDIANDYGVPVLAAQSGIVVYAGWRNNGGGYVIEIEHGNGVNTVYNHLGTIWVTAGQSVFAGQGIAGNGCSGLCTGPHVHFEVKVNGVFQNPGRYL